MFNSLRILACTAMLSVGAGNLHADTWVLDGAASHLAFGSVKKNEIAEVHSFSGLTGTVSAEGQAAIEIPLSSVETNIDIRNERMVEHVFKFAPSAKLDANFDMAVLDALGVGETTVIEVEATLTLLGQEVYVDTSMFVARLSETQVMTTTNDMVFVSTEEAGITAGIDKLMELAKLPGITRTSPVTIRLIFNSDESKA